MAMDQYLFSYHFGWGLFTSMNPSYFDVNYRGIIGFDPSPNHWIWGTRNFQTKPLVKGGCPSLMVDDWKDWIMIRIQHGKINQAVRWNGRNGRNGKGFVQSL